MAEPGIRELKRQQSKQSLQSAAIELFETQGFERTTVKQIADAAGVSPRTFFRYFPSKDEVVFGDTESDLKQLQAYVMERPADEPEYKALRGALIEFSSFIEAKKDIVLARARVIDATPRLLARATLDFEGWGEMLASCLTAREGDSLQMRHRLIAWICLHAVLVAFNEWRLGNGTRSLPKLAQEAFDLLETELGRLPGTGGGRAPTRIASPLGG